MTAAGSATLGRAIRKAITDSYYDTRNEGKTMEQAADLAATRVLNLISQAAPPDEGHTCIESCLHDCESCGHEVDHSPTFHAPGCLAARSVPPDEGLREHPDEPHEFRTTCLRCGEHGFLHVALITDGEQVVIQPRAARASRESQP